MKCARFLVANHHRSAEQRLALTVGVFLIVFPLVARAQPVAVDHCGQSISGSGFLVQDLDCPLDAPAIIMRSTGTLELRGFSIHGGEYGIRCLHSCSVVGDGTVSGADEDGIEADFHLALQNVTSTGNGFTGAKAGHVALVLDSHMEGNQRCGVQSLGTLRVSRSIITGNGCGAGADGGRIRLSQVTVSGNALGGVYGGGIRLVDSSVTGNANDPRCGVSVVCADLIAFERRPGVQNSTCGTSAMSGDPPTTTWGVCSGD